MRHFLISLIRFYQRHLSPHKGFSCAYRIHTGRASCSQLGLRAIRRYGLSGLIVLRERLIRCGDLYRRHQHRRPLSTQRGDCDLPCDAGCNMPDADWLPSTTDVIDWANCGACDGWGNKKTEIHSGKSTRKQRQLDAKS